MPRSRLARLFAIVALAASLLSFAAYAGPSAASPRGAPRIGTLLKELDGSGTVAGDAVGVSVAIAGPVAIVGAPGYAKDIGRVFVFTDTAAGWSQATELKGSDSVAGDFFGYSVALSASTAIVGSPGYKKNTGRAYVFARTPSGWNRLPSSRAQTRLQGTTSASRWP